MALIVLTSPTDPGAGAPLFPSNAFAITPADADTFSFPVAVYVGGAGNVVVTPWGGGSDVTFAMVAGAMVPVMVRAVKAASTTATLLKGIY